MKTFYPTIAVVALLFCVLILLPRSAGAASMGDYCQAPPLKSEISPNIMLVIDESGSMSWPAYFPNGYTSTEIDNAYDSGTEFEGYFDPSKVYIPDGTGIYTETTGTTTPCVKTTCKAWSCDRNDSGSCEAQGTHGCSSRRYACCTSWNTTGACNQLTGNYLNFKYMHRVDLIRWAMTGGSPASCTGSAAGNGANCDPEAWADSGNASKVGSVCNNNLDVNGDGIADGGCILLTDGGIKVKVPWARVYDGLSFKFAKVTPKPRMGAMFFSGSGVRADKVYLGDFTGANSLTGYPFYNMITWVNSQSPSGSTPTGPALWDAFNYFAMNSPQYGGFPAQSGSGDKWKNPMYNCDNGGANCSYIPCADAFVLLLSDGQWNQPACSINSSDSNGNSADPVVPAYKMHQIFTNAATGVKTKVRGVYSLGLFLGGSGELAMKNIAMYGSYDQSGGNTWPDSLTGYPNATCTATDCGSSQGSACTALPASSGDWDVDGDGVPDTYYSGNNATGIKDAILNAINDILTHTSAGTAASVLASRENSGASLLQAVYYPKRAFGSNTVSWVGNLQDLWYFIDPLLTNSNLREDGRDSSDGKTHDYIMNLKTLGQTQKDYITAFFFDKGLQAAMATRWNDDNGDGAVDGNPLPAIKIDQVANVWESGYQLWNADYWGRSVYTMNVTGTTTSSNLVQFSCTPTNCPLASTFKPYLDAKDSSNVLNDDVASTIMQWTLGYDYPKSALTSTTTYIPNYRKRQATIAGATKVWKLGDIVNSTPKISAWQPLNDYNIIYRDWNSPYGDYGPKGKSPYQSDAIDTKYYITDYKYKGRGMVFTGANDGMLHAFRLGLLQSRWPGQTGTQKGKLSNSVCSSSTSIYCTDDAHCPAGETCSKSVSLGSEAWAYLPKNVLPYLKYIADPSYCHLFTVDLTPVVFDASIAMGTCTNADYSTCYRTKDSWRTIVIGGMRLGGACRETSSTCTTCVKTPIQDPTNAAKGLGYSSYFALDITDQENPQLMWEYDGTFKNSDGTYTNKLGMAYSGPAIIRLSSRWGPTQQAVPQRNGQWYVVFGSGPTGPINSTYQTFGGRSDQNLLLHIFDLAKGPGVDNANVYLYDTGITTGFAGSISGATFDVDLDYSDDVLYVPYVYGGAGANGGLGRLVIPKDNQNPPRPELDPKNWKWSTVIQSTGPITAAPDMLKWEIKDGGNDDVWIFLGTGRYFYDSTGGLDDADPTTSRQIIGMKEYCLNANKNGFQDPCPAAPTFCASPASSATCGGLTNVDDINVANALADAKAALNSTYNGWYINLDRALPSGAPTFWGERVITNPAVDATGIVYFTTFKPQNDPCYKGGQSNIWAVTFDTGGSATGLIKGTAIMQVSTGSIEQVDLSKAFTEKSNRRTTGITGQPPTGQGVTLLASPQGESRPVLIKER